MGPIKGYYMGSVIQGPEASEKHDHIRGCHRES